MTARAPGMLGGLSVAEKKGKFNVEEFDQLGTINGQPAQDVDLESMEDKPWKKPGTMLCSVELILSIPKLIWKWLSGPIKIHSPSYL